MPRDCSSRRGSPHEGRVARVLPRKIHLETTQDFRELRVCLGCRIFLTMALKLALSEILGCSGVTKNSSRVTSAGLKTSKSSMGAWVIEFSPNRYAFYGSPANYLRSYRLQWGRADTLSKFSNRLSSPVVTTVGGDVREVTLLESGLPTIPPGTKPYFTADIHLDLVSIIVNDWPYSGECARSLLVARLLLTDSSPFVH
jgi:hypothetical protein